MWRSGSPAEHAEVRLRAFEGPTPDELAALDDIEREGDWEVGGRVVHLTNLDKVLFPGRGRERGVTKRELIAYFARIAPTMLPYLADRACNAHRYPNGAGSKGFWEKEVPSHAPEWLHRWHNDEAEPDESQWYAVLDEVAALVFMANQAALELHPWTSRISNTHEPTWALIDIDPGTSTSWEELLVLARLYRTALEHLGVIGCPKVTGGRGVHIYVPIRDGYSFDDTRAWVEQLSRVVGNTVPDLVSWKWQKSDRGGKARLDYTQNAINRTLVAPYCTRPAPGAPVSVPIEWDELDDPELRPDRWTIRTVCERVEEKGDPFAELLGVQQDLPPL
jgi:bifunctional non-homologous end joining protein LigD